MSADLAAVTFLANACVLVALVALAAACAERLLPHLSPSRRFQMWTAVALLAVALPAWATARAMAPGSFPGGASVSTAVSDVADASPSAGTRR